MEDKKTYTVFSSWGSVTIDDDGNVLDRDYDEKDEESQQSLVAIATKFDMYEYRAWGMGDMDDIDILDIGCWLPDGSYEPPEQSHRDFYTQTIEP